MAYVSVPKDMTEVKSRLIMNLTKRQVVCFGAAAAIGVPLFLSFRGAIGNTNAMMIMIAAMIPAFFFAIYTKDGVIPAEKYLLLILRQTLFYPKIRVYRTINMYAFIEEMAHKDKEGYFGRPTTPTKTGQSTAAKTQAGYGSPKSKPIS